MFLHEAKQILAVLTTLRNVFSRSNFSDNSVQVVSSMHSNVQLLYLLLFFAVGVAVLFAKGSVDSQRQPEDVDVTQCCGIF